MKKDKVLVVTSKDDPHVDFVINKLNQIAMGDRIIRFNTEDFLHNCFLTYKQDKNCLSFTDSRKEIDVKDIISVWYRRPKDLLIDPELEKYAGFIKEQTDAAITGFYFSTHFSAKWINRLDSLYRARLKVQQLELARKIGFKVPDTIVTNSPNELLNFIALHDKVSTKSLDYPNAKVEGMLFPLYNRVIDKEDLKKNIASIKYCPAIFQQYIDKVYDIRVVVIGTSITAFAIYSQEQQGSIEDVRGAKSLDLKHEVIELPKSILEKVASFVAQQGLVFSAMDLILGTDQEYYFLENNPNGQWVWLEERTGFPLSDIFINELYTGV